jgi:hypothetical protein
MSDLAAMSDMDGTTNDDTTSMVRDGSIPDSRHRQPHSLDFQIFLTVCFLTKEDQDRDCRLRIHLVVLIVPVLLLVHKNPEPNMQMLNQFCNNSIDKPRV